MPACIIVQLTFVFCFFWTGAIKKEKNCKRKKSERGDRVRGEEWEKEGGRGKQAETGYKHLRILQLNFRARCLSLNSPKQKQSTSHVQFCSTVFAVWKQKDTATELRFESQFQ